MRPRRHIAALAALIALGLAQIVSTYPQAPVTDDERRHIATGLEQLQYGTYTYDFAAPPLARWGLAAGPYLAGSRLPVHRNILKEGTGMAAADGGAALNSADGFGRNVLLARLGTLLFFAILCLATYVWARRWYSPETGLWAAGLLSLTAPILGYAALASIDLPGAAGMTVALFTFLFWLERPTRKRSVCFGAGLAFALTTNLSSLAFLPFCLFAGFVIVRPKLTLKAVWWTTLTAFLLTWACYGFSVLPLIAAWGPHPRIDEVLEAHEWLRPAWQAVSTTPFPLSEMVLGVRDIVENSGEGPESYLHFPAVFALKTPVGLLALALAGVARAGWLLRSRRAIVQTLTAVFALAILAVCVALAGPGVRHILAIYPLLAILAASVIAPLRGKLMIVPLALVAWIAVDALRAHPDYLGHVNEFASVLGNR